MYSLLLKNKVFNNYKKLYKEFLLNVIISSTIVAVICDDWYQEQYEKSISTYNTTPDMNITL